MDISLIPRWGTSLLQTKGNVMINLMIGTPMYGGQCSAHYTFSNLNLARIAKDRQVELNYQFITTESLITRGRNAIVNTFLQSNCSHLLFIDADIGFDPIDVMRLLNHKLDVVCAGYPAKLIDWASVYNAARAGVTPNMLQSYASPYIFNRDPEGNHFENLIDAIEAGTGFMMIHRKVFEQMSDHVPSYIANQFGSDGASIKEFFATSIQDGFLLSEDYHFCRKWRSLGGHVYVDKTIALQHIGTHVFQSSPNHWIG
jgi:hypothetical protein